MHQFSLYIIIGLIILLVATSGGFALYQRAAKAEIATPTQQNATYALAVDQQRQTIETLQRDAEPLAKPNKFLATRMTETESQFADAWNAIDALSLAADGSTPDELEKRANDEFQRTIEVLRSVTAH